VTTNAADYTIPDDITVAYFFHPFEGETFKRVINNLCASVAKHSRPLRIIYGNPVMRDYLIEQGFHEVRIGRALCLYTR
jgi:hypothetical protein